MKILRLLAAVLAFAVIGAHARGSVPVVNHEAVPAVRATGQPATPQQILAAMQAVGPARGWQVVPNGPTGAIATLDVRDKHRIAADITFAPGTYAIKYRDSSNMNYEAASNRIHPKYNMWVQTFMDDVRIQLAKP
jgi:hypothetical protein